MTNSVVDGWKIFAGDTLIGIAYYHHTDQPWFICTFEPTPTFEAFRSVFDQYAALVNDPSLKTTAIDIDDFYETEIASLNFTLHPFGNVWQGEVFIAQIYDGKEAWLRPL